MLRDTLMPLIFAAAIMLHCRRCLRLRRHYATLRFLPLGACVESFTPPSISRAPPYAAMLMLDAPFSLRLRRRAIFAIRFRHDATAP